MFLELLPDRRRDQQNREGIIEDARRIEDLVRGTLRCDALRRATRLSLLHPGSVANRPLGRKRQRVAVDLRRELLQRAVRGSFDDRPRRRERRAVARTHELRARRSIDSAALMRARRRQRSRRGRSCASQQERAERRLCHRHTATRGERRRPSDGDGDRASADGGGYRRQRLRVARRASRAAAAAGRRAYGEQARCLRAAGAEFTARWNQYLFELNHGCHLIRSKSLLVTGQILPEQKA